MRHHSYVTYRILDKIRGLEDVTLWAANHDEKLDGSGYPFHRTAEELGIESRIIMVADIFQALAQNRPYRLARSPQEILEILKQQAGEGNLMPMLLVLLITNSANATRLLLERPVDLAL